MPDLSTTLDVGLSMAASAGVRPDALSLVIYRHPKDDSKQSFYLLAAQSGFILKLPPTLPVLFSGESLDKGPVSYPAVTLRSFAGAEASWSIDAESTMLSITSKRRSGQISAIPTPDGFSSMQKLLAKAASKEVGDQLTSVISELSCFGDHPILDTTIKIPGAQAEIVPLSLTAMETKKGTVLAAYMATPYMLVAAFARQESKENDALPAGTTVIVPSTLMRVLSAVSKPVKGKGADEADSITHAFIDGETNTAFISTKSKVSMAFRMAATAGNLPPAKAVQAMLLDIYQSSRKNELSVSFKELDDTVKSFLRVDSSDTASVALTIPMHGGAKVLTLAVTGSGVSVTERLPFKAQPDALPARTKGSKPTTMSLLTRDLTYLSSLLVKESKTDAALGVVFQDGRIMFRTARSVGVFSSRS